MTVAHQWIQTITQTSGQISSHSLSLTPLCLPAGAVGVVRAAGGRSLLLSGDGLFQKWRHRSIRSRHLAPVCRHGCCHTLLRHLEVPLCPADQSGPDLQMTALTNELTGSSSCAAAFQRGSQKNKENGDWDNRLPLLERNNLMYENKNIEAIWSLIEWYIIMGKVLLNPFCLCWPKKKTNWTMPIL